MAKGEIAHFEQFLLLSQCFQKLSVAMLLLLQNAFTGRKEKTCLGHISFLSQLELPTLV